MEQLVLINPDEHPNEEIIFSHIGRTKSYWISIFDFFHTKHPEFDEEWRYYKDGKSWLLKIVKKKNTICWISVEQKQFKMTFYFTDRAEQAIMASTISDELKEQFKSGKYYNKIRGLTITFRNKKDVEYAKSLIEIKLTIK
ncbi:MAG: DUF3788 domain-containing protein [Melioribacteraceae bacterium]|nr:DUF3788 domain-containing protein [Melioribacteraceae bacterium]